MSPRGWLAIALTPAILGCAAGDGADTTAMESRVWGDSLVLIEELRIGSLVGAEEYTFGSVGELAPAPDGSLYVVDNQVPIIRRYDADGRFIRNVGRGGEGPGEYGRIAGMIVLHDGTLNVWDVSLRRLSTFDSTGSFVSSFPVLKGMGSWRGLAGARDGTIYVKTIPAAGFSESREGVPSDWSRVEPDRTVTRVFAAPLERAVGPNYVLAGRGGYYRPFTTATLHAMSPDGSFYIVRNDEYRIRRVLPTGDTVEIVRDEQPIELTTEELAEWEARSEHFASQQPEYREHFFPIPRVKPFIREIIADPEARLWVSRYTRPVFMEYTPEERADRERQGLPSYQWRDTPTWDVWDADGRLLGVVTLPLRTSFMTAFGDRLWGIQAGEYREDYVVRWRITRADSGR